jgi:geranylgeranyl pyrophosphate synthase
MNTQEKLEKLLDDMVDMAQNDVDTGSTPNKDMITGIVNLYKALDSSKADKAPKVAWKEES